MTAAALAVPARRERNAVETKKRLLDAAEEEFATKGFDGARRVGVVVDGGGDLFHRRRRLLQVARLQFGAFGVKSERKSATPSR